jgi:outer membrane protein OmpA-like peptidoglycan-associated protein
MMKNILIINIIILFLSGCSYWQDNTAIKSEKLTRSIKISSSSCADYQSSVQQAIQQSDFDSLEKLLFKLNRQADCSISYLDNVKRGMAQIAAARADELTQQKQIKSATTWLKRAPITTWGTQAVYGDIAAYRHQWQLAARFYHQALNLIRDKQATPQAPEPSSIRKLLKLAYQTQVLSTGSQSIFGKIRGVAPENIPIQFSFANTKLDSQAKKFLQQLASYIKQQNITELTLIGHTDTKGNHAINDKISKQRALAVKTYLQKAGVKANINIICKGKREPVRLVHVTTYTPEQINALNRRVELIL